MLFSPLGNRNILSPSPFSAVKQALEKRDRDRLRAMPVIEDPLPKQSIGYAKAASGLACVTLGGLVAWYGGRGLYNLLPSWREGSSSPALPSSEASGPLAGIKDVWSRVPGAQALPIFNVWRTGMSMAAIGGETIYDAVKEKRRGRLDLKSLYTELHQDGIQGQGVKVAVIDLFPNLHKKSIAEKEKHFPQSVFMPSGQKPHGTAVETVIRKAAPKAEINTFSAINHASMAEAWAGISKTVNDSKKNPQELTLEMIRSGLRPLIDDLADTMRKAVDSGSNVVNVSLDPDQLLPAFIKMKLVESEGRVRKQGLLMALTGVPNHPPFETEKAYYERLTALLTQESYDERLKPIQQELLAVYQPWYDALSYAAKKNVLVVIAAGNKGNLPVKSHEQGRNNINLLGLKKQDHANVMVVGSTNEEGELSDFSSEWNAQVKPDIAANGSGQLNTQGGYVWSYPKELLLCPILPMAYAEKYKNPFGTSFAAPDIVGLFALMQSARQKDKKPLLSIQEFQKVLGFAAKPVFKEDVDKYKGGIFAREQTKPEHEAIDTAIKNADAEYERLNEQVEEQGLSMEESCARLSASSDFFANQLKPLWAKRDEIWNFEKQLAEQFEQELVARQTGIHGTIAGRRLHAIQIGRAYHTEQEKIAQAQSEPEVD